MVDAEIAPICSMQIVLLLCTVVREVELVGFNCLNFCIT